MSQTKRNRTALKIVIWSLVVACSGFFAYVVLANKNTLDHLPWDDKRTLVFPHSLQLNSDGDMFVLDKGDRRISYINTRLEVMWQKNGGDSDRSFYTATFIGTDKKSGLYFFDNLLNEKTGNAQTVILKYFEPSGELKVLNWKFDVPEGEADVYNKIPFFPKLVDGKIRYLLVNQNGNTDVHAIDPNDGSDAVIQSFMGIDAYVFTSIAYDAEGHLLALKNTGEIIRLNNGLAETTTLYQANLDVTNTISNPSDLMILGSVATVLDDRARLMLINLDGSNTSRDLTPIDKAPERLWISISNPRDTTHAIIDEYSTNLMLFDTETQKLVDLGHDYVSPDRAFDYFIWSLFALSLVGVLVLLIGLYNRILRGKSSLLVKQLAIFIPLIALSVGAISYWVYSDMKQRFVGELAQKQISWASLGAQLIPKNDLLAIMGPEVLVRDIKSSESFSRLTQALAAVVGQNQQEWNQNIYDYIYLKKKGLWYVFDQYDYFERYGLKPGMAEVLKTKEASFVTYQDAYSNWLSGISPIIDESGEVVALFEITTDGKIFDEIEQGFFLNILKGVGIAILVLVLLSAVMTYWLLVSIASLKLGAKRLSEGKYDFRVDIKSKDEIADLGEVFNQMSSQIQSYVKKVIELNEANSRFVPTQFLDFLGKDSIVDIRLGDQTQKEMTVLFSDIRSFTSISEKMTPSENFNFINTYLNSMGPLIRRQNGFIDKYIGDAIMALFPDSPKGALESAFAMFESIHQKEVEQNQSLNIQIGVGIHTGLLMLGIVGEEKRFEGTVISDAVNLASRLESLTKYYGTDILISQQSVELIDDFEDYYSRVIDRVRVKGKTEAVNIYEIFIPQSPHFEDKVKFGPIYAEGMNAWQHGDLKLAQEIFEQLQVRCPFDRAASIFSNRIQGLLKSGVPDQWDGVTLLDAK